MTPTLTSTDDSSLEAALAEQTSAGTTTVIGSTVTAAGLMVGKSVPLARMAAFHGSGLGAPPAWNVFTIDGHIAFTEDISPVGDFRLVLDVEGLRDVGDHVAWAPANLYTQDGSPVPSCPRGTLDRVEKQLTATGHSALVGHEVEFVLVHSDGSRLTSPWVPFGVAGLFDQHRFIDALYAAAMAAGIELQQVHAEYGPHQFEFALPPASPVRAADMLYLARTVVSRVARAHGLAASFSPAPFAGTVGNGAHQHISLSRSGSPLFSGGDRQRGMTADGAAAVGGLVRGLPEIQGFLTGSVLSGERLAPGSWSGANACWGTENREAAVRFIAAGPASPYGANIEVKSIDPSANVYLASAAVLALAHDGIRSRAPLPDEVAQDPGRLTDAEREARGLRTLSSDPQEVIDRLDKSALARRLVGDDNVNATVACRRYEQDAFGDLDADALTQRFRLTWSA